jgi:PAS domain S-box-containing protein
MDDAQICRWLEVMPDPVVLMREDGTIAIANGQAAKLLGYTPDELAGLPLETIVPERCRKRHAECLAAYLARPVVRPMGGSLDLWALCKNGREVPVDISLSPIQTASGLLVAASIRNISVRKEEALELRSALAEVERLRDRLKMENLYLREEVQSAYGLDEIVGKSDVLKHLLEKIEQVAATDAAVLISGETGTGKELVARAIHGHSSRKDAPLVKVNCSSHYSAKQTVLEEASTRNMPARLTNPRSTGSSSLFTVNREEEPVLPGDALCDSVRQTK